MRLDYTLDYTMAVTRWPTRWPSSLTDVHIVLAALRDGRVKAILDERRPCGLLGRGIERKRFVVCAPIGCWHHAKFGGCLVYLALVEDTRALRAEFRRR